MEWPSDEWVGEHTNAVKNALANNPQFHDLSGMRFGKSNIIRKEMAQKVH